MAGSRLAIAVVAPGSRLDPALAERVMALAAERHPDVALRVHPQCFRSSGHFAGTDAERAAALLEVANDPAVDAVWFARGGYGSCRIAEGVLPRLGPAAREKTYLGYSDTGTLLAGLYRAGFPHLAHGPMPSDIARPGGEAAVLRALAFLAEGAGSALEPNVTAETPTVAFNLAILSHLIGTPLEPDLRGHVLMLEEVNEAMYRIDRALWHVLTTPALRRVAGLRLGRCVTITPNTPEFGADEETVARERCAAAGIPYLGRADIGHDIENKVVPFGKWRP